jgi:hypothetical protein
MTVARHGSTSLEMSLVQLEGRRAVQLSFDSFRLSQDRAVNRLLVEPVALYTWSAVWRGWQTARPDCTSSARAPYHARHARMADDSLR